METRLLFASNCITPYSRVMKRRRVRLVGDATAKVRQILRQRRNRHIDHGAKYRERLEHAKSPIHTPLDHIEKLVTVQLEFCEEMVRKKRSSKVDARLAVHILR